MAVSGVWVGLVDWESLSVAMVLVVQRSGWECRGQVVQVVQGYVRGQVAQSAGAGGDVVVMPGMALLVVGRAVAVV